jgi:DNA-binding GntR family transcriptional regulator
MSAIIAEFPRSAGLHAGLLEGMRKLINEGDLAPGARVPERELCERFGVSRTPLRECLKVLAAEGLVELLPNRGARIATLDGAGLVHLFEVIAALEAEGGRLACERMTEAELAEVQSLHYRMYAHYLRQELPQYFALNQAIHEAVIRASRNPVLISTHNALAARITRARYMSNRLSPDRWKAAMDEHGAMLELLLARDGARLGPLLARHLQNKRDIIREALQRRENGAGSHPGLLPDREGAEAG